MILSIQMSHVSAIFVSLIASIYSQSLVDDPIWYDTPTCSEDSDSEVEKENVVTKKNPQLGRAARNKKTKVRF